MNVGGLTHVQSENQENASVSGDMYNNPPGLETTTNNNHRVNGTILSRTSSNNSQPSRKPIGQAWRFPTSPENHQPTKEEFYQSYDPKIGLHTAAVLGGILVWLIVYLVYRTKCKKAIIRFFKTVSEQRKQKRSRASFVNLSKHSSMGADIDTPPSIIVTNDKNETVSNHVIVKIPVETPTSVHKHDAAHADNQIREAIQKLPSLETDVTMATAQWVKEQPLSIQSLQELPTDLIRSKIPTFCPPVRDPRLVKSACGLDHTWNKSLPSLSQNIEVNSYYSSSEAIHSSTRGKKSPCENPSSDSGIKNKSTPKFSEDLRTTKRILPKLTITIPDSISTKPSGTNLDTKTRLNDTRPIPVTPTVKIQNYTSKRCARSSSSLHRQISNDSLSSNSSVEPLLSEWGSTPNVENWHNRGSKHQIWPAAEKLKDPKKWEQSSVSLLSDENMTETVL
ncbi:uncharacterized protein LOC126831121 [Patella vulgata]|uniref:uncharacterized protein LOC126831121 n=1 Tax=Patella vulgata TaxID=6465 RepID=UPI0024A8CF71|nr:uncharacterized protein LOC126831121 [Patella vulgata]